MLPQPLRNAVHKFTQATVLFQERIDIEPFIAKNVHSVLQYLQERLSEFLHPIHAHNKSNISQGDYVSYSSLSNIYPYVQIVDINTKDFFVESDNEIAIENLLSSLLGKSEDIVIPPTIQPLQEQDWNEGASLFIQQYLTKCTIEGNKVHLPSEYLSRDRYEEVKNLFARIRGVWKSTGKHENGTPKGYFLFTDYSPAPIIQTILDKRRIPPKNPTDFFPTPEKVLEIIKEILLLHKKDTFSGLHTILEPSAGTGAIVEMLREIFPKAWLEVVEGLDVNAAILTEKNKHQELYNVLHKGDFLSMKKGNYGYDVIVMNPPFTAPKKPKAFIDHIYKAWSMLNFEGKLIAIVPQFIYANSHSEKVGILPNNAQLRSFAEFVLRYGIIEDLPEGSFKESGTGVKTQLLIMDKPEATNITNKKPYHGFPSFAAWNTFVSVYHGGQIAVKPFENIERSTKNIDEFVQKSRPILEERILYNNYAYQSNIYLTESEKIHVLQEIYKSIQRNI